MSKITPLYVSEMALNWYDITVQENDARQISEMLLPVDDACESAAIRTLTFESEPSLFEQTLNTEDTSS